MGSSVTPSSSRRSSGIRRCTHTAVGTTRTRVIARAITASRPVREIASRKPSWPGIPAKTAPEIPPSGVLIANRRAA